MARAALFMRSHACVLERTCARHWPVKVWGWALVWCRFFSIGQLGRATASILILSVDHRSRYPYRAPDDTSASVEQYATATLLECVAARASLRAYFACSIDQPLPCGTSRNRDLICASAVRP